jgi:hypothetical protein
MSRYFRIAEVEEMGGKTKGDPPAQSTALT